MSLKQEKELWIRLMYEQCLNDNKVKGIKANPNNKMTMVFYEHSRYRKDCGISYCSPDDVYDGYTGIAIAYARLIGAEIPPYVLKDILTIEDVQNGQLFDCIRTQERYCKINKAYSGGYRCTNIKTGKHTTFYSSEEIQLPFKW